MPEHSRFLKQCKQGLPVTYAVDPPIGIPLLDAWEMAFPSSVIAINTMIV